MYTLFRWSKCGEHERRNRLSGHSIFISIHGIEIFDSTLTNTLLYQAVALIPVSRLMLTRIGRTASSSAMPSGVCPDVRASTRSNDSNTATCFACFLCCSYCILGDCKTQFEVTNTRKYLRITLFNETSSNKYKVVCGCAGLVK